MKLNLSASDKKLYQTFLQEYTIKDVEGRTIPDADKASYEFLRHKCRTDLFFLGSEIFGWKNAKQGKRSRVDPVFHRWLAKIFQLDGDKMVLVPRKHLKTTWMKAYVVQRILNNPMIRILLVSVSSTLMETELTDIKKLLCTPVLIDLFPEVLVDPGKGFTNWQKCTQDRVTVLRDNQEAAHGDQILAVGVGTKIQGLHFDLVIMDDVVDPGTVRTLEQIRKVEEYWEYLQAIAENDAEFMVLGTFYHYNDLYCKIQRERQIKNIYIKKCADDDVNFENILYKSWFTKEYLMKMKSRMSTYTWSCQMMLNPIAKEDQVFPPPQPTYNGQLPADVQGYQFFIAMDPAATVEKYSDQTGLVVAAKNHINQVFIVEAIGMKRKADELVSLLIKKCIQYNPVRVAIELGQQTALKSLIDAMRIQYEQVNHVKVPINLYTVPVSRAMSKKARIENTFGAFCRQQNVFVNDQCKALLAEMDHFTGKEGGEDNLVDAASMIFAVIDKYMYNYWVKRSYKTGGGETFADLLNKNKKKGWIWRSVA